MNKGQAWGSQSWSWLGTLNPLHVLINGCCRLLCFPHLWLLQWYLTGICAVKVTVNTPSVQVTRGGSALLPCLFRTTAALNRLNIIWTVSPLVEPQHPLQVISYEQGQVVESLSDYLGRVRFAFHPTKDASIIINQTRTSDTGTYQCTVINPPDGATPNIGLIGLTVLVPLSSPQCSSEGQMHEGGSIHLHCYVREGVPAPRFTWKKIPPDNQVLVTKQEDYHGSLLLTNVSSETSGLYRCTVSNQLGAHSCAVELHVDVADLGIMGIVVGITITLVMGLVLLALFALVLCLHQQSRGKQCDPNDKMHTQVQMDTLSPRDLRATKTSVNDPITSIRTTKPLWVLSSQAGKPPTHILYDIRQSQVSLTTDYRPSRNIEQYSTTESEEEDSYSTPEPTPIHPTNSGFLV
ncbi:immunoglobulin superfamily member 11-like [Pelobates cultripes]|nr:immunoglobulin superfamily member 11-like [Pelobates cultripes]